FRDPAISPAAGSIAPTVLAIDIETKRDGTELYAISLAMKGAGGAAGGASSSGPDGTKDYARVLYLGQVDHPDAECFGTLRALLERFSALILELDPDIITGWNVIDFDLKMLEQFYRTAGLPFAIGRTEQPCKLFLEQSFFSDSRVDMPGRMVLDGIWLLKTSGVKLPNYKLETAAARLLGKEKLITGDSRFLEIERLRQEDPKALVDYNLKDSQLVLDIIQTTHALQLTVQRSMLTRMAMDRIRSSIASLDSLYLHEVRKRGMVSPTNIIGERDERIKGGYVRESKPGIYENIAVFDFKSLYPSIIRTFNIDPAAYLGQHDELGEVSGGGDAGGEDRSHGGIIAPNGAVFSREPGILPELIQRLWAQRDEAKKRKDKNASNAIKLLMNSFFGVLANPACRFYNINVANAITHFGQELIKLCADHMNEMGYEVIYGDTDSVFVDLKAADFDAAHEEAKQALAGTMGFLTKTITKRWGVQSYLDLEFEHVFKKLLMPHLRGTEKGAKKRYAGIIVRDGREQMYYTGLEVVRSDWTDLAKQFQVQLLERIFAGEEIKEFVKDYFEKLQSGQFDDLLIYRKAIRKPVEEYTKTTPPHIQAARKAGRTGVGIMEYVWTRTGPEAAEAREHPFDYIHYSEKQLRPIADSVLSFIGLSYEDIVSGKQKSLFDY
ncbi:DNA polymerase II, partial [Candidatus Woesearchaeota archaeon CG11_big_fil_rev_8_21_14_0_20_57_5]